MSGHVPSMANLIQGVMRGMLAGAAGTTALNATTYLDMALRGRPGSSTPEATVQRIADIAGTSVPGEDDSARQARTSGLGALMGLGAGIGTGAVLGAMRALGRPRSRGGTFVVAWVLAMLAGNAPMTGLGVTDPRQWAPADWLADLVPHAAYALVTAAALQRLDLIDRWRRPTAR